jgi:hypothetical protein
VILIPVCFSVFVFSVSLQTPRRFFTVFNGAVEGVVWQDVSGTGGFGGIFVTWFASNFASASTVALPRTAGHQLYCAAGNGNGEIAYITAFSTSNPDKITPCVVLAIRASATGAQLASSQLAASASGISFWGPFSSGAAMAWDVANGRVGVMLSKLNPKSSDGLNHQNGIALVLTASTMALQKNFGQTSSHSFGNSIQLGNDGAFLAADIRSA